MEQTDQTCSCVSNVSHSVYSAATFNPFPEVIAVPSHRCEFAQVMISAPDVHILIFWATDYEGVVVTEGKQSYGESVFCGKDAFHSTVPCIYEQQRL